MRLSLPFHVALVIAVMVPGASQGQSKSSSAADMKSG